MFTSSIGFAASGYLAMYFLYAFLLLTMLRLSALTVVEDDESALSSAAAPGASWTCTRVAAITADMNNEVTLFSLAFRSFATVKSTFPKYCFAANRVLPPDYLLALSAMPRG